MYIGCLVLLVIRRAAMPLTNLNLPSAMSTLLLLADPTLPQVGHQAVRTWVTQAVDGVRAYLGEFPVEQLFLAIHVRGPRGVTRAGRRSRPIHLP